MNPIRITIGRPRKQRCTETDPPEPTLRLLHPRALHRLRDPHHPVALADPTRLPLETGSVDHLTLEDDLLPDEVLETLRECARVLAPGGTLTAYLRPGSGRHALFRRLVNALFQLPDTPNPTTFPNLLLPLAFDRIETTTHNRRPICRARRLPGRPWSLIEP